MAVCSILCAVSADSGLAASQAPPIAPRWAFEPWVWEDNGNTRASITELVAGYQKRNIPVGAVLIDSPWSTAYNDFIWNPNRYPDPAGMIREFHRQGIRVVLWMTGNINSSNKAGTEKEVPLARAACYDEVEAKGFGVNNSAGKLDWWKGEGLHVDITNPKAAQWFAGKLDPIMDMGIDGWKTDQGVDAVPDPTKVFAGLRSRQQYKEEYYSWMSDYTRRRNSQGIIQVRPYSHQGGFGASVQKCIMGWCGDFSGDFAGLQLQMDNLYRSANACYGPLQVEVGGYYRAKPEKAQLIRYAQFGSLMPGMENGGSNGGLTHHVPWWQDEQNGGGTETTDIYRYFATLHSELVPYIFSAGVDGHLNRRPIVRQADTARAQHLLGDDIFVSVMTNEAKKQVVFPEGKWIDFWQREQVFEGGASLDLTLPLNRYPVYFRAGSIIPLNVRNSVTGHGDAQSAGATTLLIFPAGQTSRTFYRPLGDGVEYTPVKIIVEEAKGTITVEGKRKHDWILRVQSFAKPLLVHGAESWRYDADAHCVIVKVSGKRCRVTLDRLDSYSKK